MLNLVEVVLSRRMLTFDGSSCRPKYQVGLERDWLASKWMAAKSTFPPIESVSAPRAERTQGNAEKSNAQTLALEFYSPVKRYPLRACDHWIHRQLRYSIVAPKPMGVSCMPPRRPAQDSKDLGIQQLLS